MNLRRRIAVVLTLGALGGALAVEGSGCALLVDVDKTYALSDGAPGSTDASLADASVDGAGGSDGGDASTGADAADASGSDAAAGPWMFDREFGILGVQQLTDSVTGSISLPVIALDPNGGVHVAFERADQTVEVCGDPLGADACAATPFPNRPVELLFQGTEQRLLVTAGSNDTAEVIQLYDLENASVLFPVSAACIAGRGLSLSPTGDVLAAALCGTSAGILRFTSTSVTTSTTFTFAEPSVLPANEVLGDDGTAWAVGCSGCPGGTSTATFLHVGQSTSMSLSGGLAGPATFASTATDLLLVDGGALLGGTYSGSNTGLFTVVVPATGALDAGFVPEVFGVEGSLQSEPAGHTRFARTATGNVLVGTLTDRTSLVILTVDDQGRALPASGPPQILALPDAVAAGLDQLAVGGVVTSGGAIYVALGATFEAYNSGLVGVARLIPSP